MKARRLGTLALLCGVVVGTADATVQQDLDDAAAHGNAAFILVTEPGAQNLESARSMIREAMREVRGSVLVELDRSDPSNALLVSQFRLAGAPVPLILVAASNGVVAGGMPAKTATSESLQKLVPSPKKAEVLQAIQSGKTVFLLARRAGMGADSGVFQTCSRACQQLNDRAVTVEIDLGDEAEAEFLAQLKVDRASSGPTTLVINPQGQVAGTFAGDVDIASLVQSATKRVGGCCPSGSSQSCGPGKK